MTAKIRVLLVDDHEIVRLGLLTLINDQPDMQVVGETGNAAGAVDLVSQLNPQVVLMDVRLPDESGIITTREISRRYPEIKIVILTSYADDALVLQAIKAGAVGYILKQVGNMEVLKGIRAAAQNEAILDTETTARLLAYVRAAERKVDVEAFRELSDRELEVLAELSTGKTNAEIGAILNLQEKTVRNYVSNILVKLGLTNRIELAVYAHQHNLSERLKFD